MQQCNYEMPYLIHPTYAVYRHILWLDSCMLYAILNVTYCCVLWVQLFDIAVSHSTAQFKFDGT